MWRITAPASTARVAKSPTPCPTSRTVQAAELVEASEVMAAADTGRIP